MTDSDALGAVDPDERVEVSVVLRPRHPLEELAARAEPLSREEFAASYGADEADIQKIEAFARQHGYVQTVTGRRRYIRDITSSNNTLRGSAERNASSSHGLTRQRNTAC